MSLEEFLMKLSQKVQNQLSQFEQVRQQLQMLTTQRVQVDSQLRELNNALEELNKASKDIVIYNKVGSLLFKIDDIKKLKKELTEHQETFDVRMKTLERQENQLKERYTELQKDISKAVQELE